MWNAVWSDNFNRADETPIGSPWANAGAAALPNLSANKLQILGRRRIYNPSLTLPDDHYALVAVNTGLTGPVVRLQATSGGAYWLDVNNGRIYRQASASEFGTILASGWAGPTRTRLQVRGSTLEACTPAGVVVGTATDATYSTGTVGVYGYYSSTLDDDFACGEWVADPPIPRYAALVSCPWIYRQTLVRGV